MSPLTELVMTALAFILVSALLLVVARLVVPAIGEVVMRMSPAVAPACVVACGMSAARCVRRGRALLCDASSDDDPDASFPPQPMTVQPLIRAAERPGTSRRRFGVRESWSIISSRA
jgi:hypothetical protein